MAVLLKTIPIILKLVRTCQDLYRSDRSQEAATLFCWTTLLQKYMYHFTLMYFCFQYYNISLKTTVMFFVYAKCMGPCNKFQFPKCKFKLFMPQLSQCEHFYEYNVRINYMELQLCSKEYLYQNINMHLFTCSLASGMISQFWGRCHTVF